jgi:SAM-dependent methyltransferase
MITDSPVKLLAPQTYCFARMILPGRRSRQVRSGYCNICGRGTIFLCPDISTIRNTNNCLFCGSSSRKRHVANEILRIYDADANSIKRSRKLRQFRVLNTGWRDSLTRSMADSDRFFHSEYFPDIIPGTEIEERGYCEDLQNLSFPNDYFDLVITEDVLEHVRDYKKALVEIRRVLKQGGHHIFTVPCRFDEPTLVRVDTSGDMDVFVTEPEYHGGWPTRKILAYRTYGTDLLDELDEIGFDSTVSFSQPKDLEHGIVDSYVFVSHKN